MIRRLRLLIICLLVVMAVPWWAADVTGNWQVTITTADGAISSGKVVLRTQPQPGRTVAFNRCDLTLTGGKMTGTIDKDKGRIEFLRSKQ